MGPFSEIPVVRIPDTIIYVAKESFVILVLDSKVVRVKLLQTVFFLLCVSLTTPFELKFLRFN